MAGPFTPRDRTGDGAAARGSSSGFAIASLVCGIVGLFFLEIILGPFAIIFGALALRRASEGGRHRILAWAGLALGIIDVLLFIVILAVARHRALTWHAG
jgi:hypothetical protein